jgi:hypothetical protein
MIQPFSSVRTNEVRIGAEPFRSPIKFIAHSFRATSIAMKYGWLPGARYSNLRDAKRFERLGFLDISWKDYNFVRHIQAAKATRPIMTVARDVDEIGQLGRTLDEAR